MDPFTLLTGGLGTILSGVGAFGTYETAQKEARIAAQEASVSGNITQLQGQENAQRQLAMQISSRRAMTQNFRQTQQTMAMNLAAGTNQGAAYGNSSGVAGGIAGARATGAFNQLGLQQNLDIGNTLFGLQGQITTDQVTMASLQGQQATLQGQGALWSALSSIGGSLMGSAGPAGKLLGNFFNNSSDPSYGGAASANSAMGGIGLPQGAATGSLY